MPDISVAQFTVTLARENVMSRELVTSAVIEIRRGQSVVDQSTFLPG